VDQRDTTSRVAAPRESVVGTPPGRMLAQSVCTSLDCQTIVVLRNTDQYTVELGVQHADWLRALNVSVSDYHLSHAVGAGRTLPIETFHAKLIVADDTLAYVGSANLLSSSEGLSLETGLLVEGAAAVQVARLVDAVLRAARPL
jgi:hypothetical protein